MLELLALEESSKFLYCVGINLPTTTAQLPTADIICCDSAKGPIFAPRAPRICIENPYAQFKIPDTTLTYRVF